MRHRHSPLLSSPKEVSSKLTPKVDQYSEKHSKELFSTRNAALLNTENTELSNMMELFDTSNIGKEQGKMDLRARKLLICKTMSDCLTQLVLRRRVVDINIKKLRSKHPYFEIYEKEKERNILHLGACLVHSYSFTVIEENIDGGRFNFKIPDVAKLMVQVQLRYLSEALRKNKNSVVE